MRPRASTGPLACLLALAACAAPEPGSADTPAARGEAASGTARYAARDGWRSATSRAGMFTARWRPVPAPIPVNEPFELELVVEEGGAEDGGGEPLVGGEVFVSAWMPDHGHGMVREPRAVEVAPGRYRVRGMLLHMGGSWQLFVDVVRGGISERAEFEVELP